MAALPTEIITQILSKLPAKSLLRFKCVCKSWYSLIKDPNFIKLHLNQTLSSDSNRHLLLCDTSFHCAELDLHQNNHLSFSELPLPVKDNDVDFIGSCNGIICISNTSKTAIFLYNPLTRSHFNLVANPIQNLCSNVTLFGFGYDSISDDYKVLRIVQGYKDDGVFYNDVQVFSLKNDSWKCVKGIPKYFAYKDVHGVLVNEVLHYNVFSKGLGEPDYLGMKMVIASFDLRTDSFSVMDCPPWGYDNIDKFSNSDTLGSFLRELGGSLSVMKNFLHDFILYRADLWVMKEYGKKESWVRLFTIRLSELENHWCVMPIVYSKDGRKVLVQIDGTWFEWYDLVSNNVERFTIHGVPDDPCETGVFMGSLVSFQDKLHPKGDKKPLPMKHKKKKDVDKFLSAGFKLRL